jgi:hypothetical protein
MKMDRETLWLAVGVLGAVFLYLFLVTFLPTGDNGNDHAKTIVPFLLGTVTGTIICWRFGSSKGSEDKTTMAARNTNDAAKILAQTEAKLAAAAETKEAKSA